MKEEYIPAKDFCDPQHRKTQELTLWKIVNVGGRVGIILSRSGYYSPASEHSNFPSRAGDEYGGVIEWHNPISNVDDGGRCVGEGSTGLLLEQTSIVLL